MHNNYSDYYWSSTNTCTLCEIGWEINLAWIRTAKQLHMEYYCCIHTGSVRVGTIFLTSCSLAVREAWRLGTGSFHGPVLKVRINESRYGPFSSVFIHFTIARVSSSSSNKRWFIRANKAHRYALVFAVTYVGDVLVDEPWIFLVCRRWFGWSFLFSNFRVLLFGLRFGPCGKRCSARWFWWCIRVVMGREGGLLLCDLLLGQVKRC